MPRLLVSVKNLDEAKTAIQGGCDLLDIKDPAKGPLGMADLSVIADICAWVNENSLNTPVSAALGELGDWTARRQISSELNCLDYAKLGNSSYQSVEQWDRDLKLLKLRFQKSHVTQPAWINVCYADHRQADCFSLEEFLSHASSMHFTSNVSGLLIDTWDKAALRLPECITVETIRQLSESLKANQQLLALAGRLQKQHLEIHSDWLSHADYLGVRSAVCFEENRHAQIDSSFVSWWSSQVRELDKLCSK